VSGENISSWYKLANKRMQPDQQNGARFAGRWQKGETEI
jgi:hypothetical protein